MKISATAPGKLILLGEYAVLEGAPALVIAVNRFAEVTLQTISSKSYIIESPAIGISNLPFTIKENGKISFLHSISQAQQENLNFFSATFEHALQFYKQHLTELPAFKITLNTSQFFNESDNQKLGLGSSAALTSALIAGLIQFGDPKNQIEKETNFLFNTALQAHRRAQGNIGSGIDISASVFGGVLKYQLTDKEFSKVPLHEKLTIPDDLHILIIWTGESASTKQFIRNIETFKRKEFNNFKNIMNRMYKISALGIEALKQKNTLRYLEAVKEYYNEMKNLGNKSSTPIVSKNHQEISDLVTTSGGVYKPSGAGGGDLGVAFSNSLKTQEVISKNLENTNFKIINLDIAEKGIQIITE